MQVSIPCAASAIPYPEAAKIGDKGIVRDLLLGNAGARAFSTLPVQVIIDYKWRLYARSLLLHELGMHLLLLTMFTLFGYFLGSQPEYEHPRLRDDICLFTCTILGFFSFVREFNQLHFYLTQYKINGVVFWLKSGWNWMEVTSYVILVILLPANRLSSENILTGRQTSDFVAVTLIMLWWKVLCYARAFEPTGPMVIMIGEIIKDIFYFLLLACLVLFGFGMAFFVIYRQVDH